MKGRSFTWWELTAVNVRNLRVLIKETVNSLLTSRCRKAIMWMPNKNAAIISTNLLYYLVPHHKEAISILCEGGSFTSLSLLKNAPFQGQVDYSVIHNVSHEVPSRTHNLQNTVTFCMLDGSYPKKKRLFIICYTEEEKKLHSVHSLAVEMRSEYFKTENFIMHKSNRDLLIMHSGIAIKNNLFSIQLWNNTVDLLMSN